MNYQLKKEITEKVMRILDSSDAKMPTKEVSKYTVELLNEFGYNTESEEWIIARQYMEDVRCDIANRVVDIVESNRCFVMDDISEIAIYNHICTVYNELNLN